MVKEKTERRKAVRTNEANLVGTVKIDSLPPRSRNKTVMLMLLPEVREFKERIRAGLGVGEAVFVRLDKDKMTQMMITTPGRIIKEDVRAMIEADKLKTKDGKPLDVKKYKGEDGSEVVFVADRVTVVNRSAGGPGGRWRG